MFHTELVSVGSLDVQVSFADVEAQTIEAYERLASEYDSEEHATTRTLEQLGIDACADLITGNPSITQAARVLEVGCGTGALSSLLLRTISKGTEFVFLDASASMLDAAKSRFASIGNQRLISYVQASILSQNLDLSLGHFDVIASGLGDPYIIQPALANIRRYCARDAYFIATLPSREWAVAERQFRLKVPLTRTRFKLISGEVVEPFSFTYAEDELHHLLSKEGFQVLKTVSKTGILSRKQNADGTLLPPGVLGVLARAI
jgi:ubiquinone/menaquinone biosynthesis C-methylase UbiE